MLSIQAPRWPRRLFLDNLLPLNILPDGSTLSPTQVTENKSHVDFYRPQTLIQVLIFQDFADKSLFRKVLRAANWIAET
jgi:hypothetical protein